MLTNLSINSVLSIKARILAKNPCIENTGIFSFALHTVYTVYTVYTGQNIANIC